jgi:O-6-methylguanine DNA methyltransferase
MRKIQPGKTMSYSELAAAIGHPKSARAVGGAVGRNRLLLLLPCHRVVGKNGLGGFRVGLDWKRKLLALEAAHA